MNKEDLAGTLDGLQYGKEIPEDLAFEADDAGLVVIFRCSDGLTKVRGAIWDETWYPVIMVTQNGLSDEETIERPCNKIRLLQNMEGYRWIYETTIQHTEGFRKTV
jgi:hypothetical protein